MGILKNKENGGEGAEGETKYNKNGTCGGEHNSVPYIERGV